MIILLVMGRYPLYISIILLLSVQSLAVCYAKDAKLEEEFTFARKAFEDKFYDLAKERLEALLK